MKIITLSGLDGSGKSTQIELLKDYLKSRDKTFFYFHAVEFSVGNKVLKRSKNPPQSPFRKGGGADSLPFVKGEPERDLDKSVTKASWLKIQLRKLALFIDVIRFKCLVKKTKADYIISDRYFYDSVVNICYLSVIARELCDRGNPVQCRVARDCFASLAMTVIQKYIPKPDFAFYINAKPEIIMQRERKPDQGMEYLIAKEKLFADKIKKWNMIVIDGEKGKEEIFEKIKQRALSLS